MVCYFSVGWLIQRFLYLHNTIDDNGLMDLIPSLDRNTTIWKSEKQSQ